MRSAPFLLWLSLSIVGCAGPSRPSATKAASPDKERPPGIYLDTFDDPEFQRSLDSSTWLADPAFAEPWKARGVCREFEQRFDPRFFRSRGANNTAYLSGLVGDFESLLYVDEVWVNEEGTAEESIKCVLTPRLTSDGGGMQDYLQRLGLELGPPVGFSSVFGVLHETSKSRWFVIPDPADPSRFHLLYHPSVIDNPRWQEFAEFVAPPRDRLAGKQASQWRSFYLAAAAAGVEAARTALHEFDGARAERANLAHRRFKDSAGGPPAERLQALAECTEALATRLDSAVDGSEEALQTYRDDLAALVAATEAEARDIEAARPARARVLSLLGRAVTRDVTGNPVNSLDGPVLAAQHRRLVRFADAAERLDRVQGVDWREDLETLYGILEENYSLRNSEDPDEKALFLALPMAVAGIMAAQHGVLAETARARGLHSTAAGHFYLAFNLHAMAADVTAHAGWELEPEAELPSEPYRRALQLARREALGVLYEFFPWQRTCADGPEGFRALPPAPDLLSRFLDRALGGPKGINLTVSEEALTRLASENCRNSMCVWASAPEFNAMRDEYVTNQRTVEWQERSGTIPSVEYRDWLYDVEQLENELRGLEVLMSEALERANTVTSWWTGDLADKYTRFENGWEITVTTNPETGTSKMFRYEACPQLGLDARDEWISEEAFRALKAGVEVDPEPAIQSVIDYTLTERRWRHAEHLGQLDGDKESIGLERLWFDLFFNSFTGQLSEVPSRGTMRRYLLASRGETR